MKDVTYDIVTSTPLSENAPNFFCGVMYGRHITVEYLPNNNALELRMGTSGLSKSCKIKLRDRLSKYFKDPKVQIQFDDHTVCAILSAKDNWLDYLTHLIDVIDEACASIELKSGCFLCGECNQDIFAKQIGTMSAYMCSECSERLGKEMRGALKEKHDNSRFTMYANSNIEIHEVFSMGVLGSIAGAIAGSILWLLVVNIPYIAYALCGFFLTFLIFFGYKVLATALSVKGLLFCSAILIISFIICFSITQSMYIFLALQNMTGENIESFGEVFFSFPHYLFDERFNTDLVDDLMLGVLGSIIAFGHRLFLYRREN